MTQGANVRTFTHDAMGNVTADDRAGTSYNYRYNNRARLDRLTIGATVTADYTYDGLERLALRTTQNMSPAGTTHYVYDRRGRLIAESDASANTAREYVWLDDMPLAVVADVDTSTPKLWFVHADHLDRPLKMTDATQATVWDAVFRPFGEVVSITGAGSNNLRFPGQYFLIESGLHYNWHRHYDPTIGRYLQADALGFVDGPSVYSYVRSQPVTKADPDGQQVVIPLPGRTPGFPLPPMLDWQRQTELAIARLLNRFSQSGTGSGGSSPGCCEERYNEEVRRCYQSKWQVAHPDYHRACLDRARIRYDLCVRNSGKPNPDEPPEWTPGPDKDEETWRNPNR